MSTENNFIGQGLTFPLELENGRGVLKTGLPLVISSIRVITTWPEGHRFMLGEFGTKIIALLEEPSLQVVKAGMKSLYQKDLATWEPRVEILNITVESPELHRIEVRGIVRLVNSTQEKSFVHPYYRNINT